VIVVRRIALTGGIATGKSHVRAEIERLGVPTIDADQLAREAVAPGSEGRAAVAARFGTAVVGADGTIDRRALAAIVFADPGARRDLEAIIHPVVRRRIDKWFASLDASAHPFAVADIPLLFETGREGEFDAVIVAACDPATQLRRVMERDGLSEADAMARISAQIPIADKVRRADHVVPTDGTFAETAARVRALVERLGTRTAS
jgi:dephospho-CoA kinase